MRLVAPDICVWSHISVLLLQPAGLLPVLLGAMTGDVNFGGGVLLRDGFTPISLLMLPPCWLLPVPLSTLQ